MYVCICMYVCFYVYVCMYVCKYVYLCVYVRIHVWTHVHTHFILGIIHNVVILLTPLFL